MEFSITVLPGDGVGPEVVAEGAKALKAIGKAFNHDFKLNYGSIGAKAYETEGSRFQVIRGRSVSHVTLSYLELWETLNTKSLISRFDQSMDMA